MKALFNSVRNDSGKLNKYLINAKEMGIKILPPNINESDMYFRSTDTEVLFGLAAISNIGDKLAQEIIDERNRNGKFKNMNDLLERVKLNKTQIVMLIKSGAIPSKDKSKALMKYCHTLFVPREYKDVKTTCSVAELRDKYGIVTKDKEERLRMYNDIRRVQFKQEQENKLKAHCEEFAEKYMEDPEYWEFEALSIFIDNNPFSVAYDYIRPFDEVEDDDEAVVVGIISKIQKKKDKNGKTFAYVNMYSAFGIIEILIWHSQYKKFDEILTKGNSIAVLCKKGDGTPICKDIKPYRSWEMEVLNKLKGGK